jgi:hypothetical protein
MWLDNVSQEAVDRFWQQCGEPEPFPRTLEKSVSLALPVAIVKLPRLKLHIIESWLARCGVPYSFNCRSRSVRGCLIAYGGHGTIFIDGTDRDDEQRFTIAHELGHFMSDYLIVRETAISKFGELITDVLDGLRRPTVTERVHAALASTSLVIYTNLMERDEKSNSTHPGVWKIEDRADRIALALLAPPEDVISSTDISADNFQQRHRAMMSVLCERFGLPVQIADTYAWSLLENVGRGPSWAETLRPR